MRRSRLLISVFSIPLGLMLAYCGSKGSSDETTTPDSSDKATTTSGLSTAYPGSLALTVFPQSTTSLRLAAEEAFDPNELPLKEKIAEQEKIVAGTADSCMPAALHKTINATTAETCYEFDQDMLYGTADTTQTPTVYLGTKNGKDAKGEACLVSFTRNQVSQVVAMVDQTLGFGMAALCQYKKDNTTVSLPAVGASIDLASSLKSLFGDKMTVTAATLERLEDSNDFPVYRIIIKAALGAGGVTRTVGVIHSPFNDDNTEYSGTMYTIMEGVPEFAGGPAGKLGATPPPPAATNDKYQMMSVTYKRTIASGKTTLTAELRSAQMDKTLAASAIDSSGVLDLNVGTNIATATLGSTNYGEYTGFPQANDAVAGITFVGFSLDPDSNEGTLAYWKNPGGNYYENARGFNISIAANATTSVLEGCATSGSASIDFSNGISIRRYLNPAEAANSLTLSPKGFWHPFMNSPTSSGSDSDGSFKLKTQGSGQQTKWYVPSVGDTTLADTFVTKQDGGLITRQCFAYDSATSLYAIDTAQTSSAAGYELLDTGNTSNAGKFIALPPPVAPPAENVFKKI
jgi:hypothetical protein